MSAQYSEVFILVCELAEALGATPLNKHPGCWETSIGDWHFAINAHDTTAKTAEGADLPPVHLYVSFKGMPCMVLTPIGGIALGQSGEAEADLIPVLREALAKARTT